MDRSPASPSHSPSPLPIPPLVVSSRDVTPVPHSEAEEGEVDSNTSGDSELAAIRAREAVDFVNAVSRAPKGMASNAALSAPGWHTSDEQRETLIPTVGGSWGQVPARFQRFYIHPWSAEPTLDAAEGEDTGIYGKNYKLRRSQRPPPPQISKMSTSSSAPTLISTALLNVLSGTWGTMVSLLTHGNYTVVPSERPPFINKSSGCCESSPWPGSRDKIICRPNKI